MSGRLLRWAGALLATGSAIAMTVYLLTVGTDRANPHRPGGRGQESGAGPGAWGRESGV